MGVYRNWRRKRILSRNPIDAQLWRSVTGRLPFLRGMEEEGLERLRELAILFLAEKEMHGAAGMELSDEGRLSIAVQACLPILNLGLDIYEGWVGIIVYPAEFRVPKQEMDENGVVHEFEDELSGEAWPGGPVVLSWQDATMSGAGYNVVIHEFAHKIHMLREDDEAYPLAFPGMNARKWREVLKSSYERLCREVDSGEPTIIDEYAAEHPAEFFAVMSEAFFTDSAIVARAYPALYAQLAQYYRQDPARALPSGSIRE